MIRIAELKDAKEIANILKECYKIDSIEEGIAVFNEERNKGIEYIVAVENEKIVGITTWLMHGLYKHGLVELDRIAVASEGRGKGVAKELFNALINSASKKYTSQGSKLRKVFLMTHASNIRAHQFYEKMGMAHEATIPNHYRTGEDEWVYGIYL